METEEDDMLQTPQVKSSPEKPIQPNPILQQKEFKRAVNALPKITKTTLHNVPVVHSPLVVQTPAPKRPKAMKKTNLFNAPKIQNKPIPSCSKEVPKTPQNILARPNRFGIGERFDEQNYVQDRNNKLVLAPKTDKQKFRSQTVMEHRKQIDMNAYAADSEYQIDPDCFDLLDEMEKLPALNLEPIPSKISQEEVEEEFDLDESIKSLNSIQLIEEGPKDDDLCDLLNQEEGDVHIDHDLHEDDHHIGQLQARGQEEFGQENGHFHQDLQTGHCDQLGDVTGENGQSTDQMHPVNEEEGVDQLDDHNHDEDDEGDEAKSKYRMTKKDKIGA